MISVSRFQHDDEAFLDLLRVALGALADCPGFVRGRVGRSQDESSAWLLTTEWEGVASYRRALSPYVVKVALAAVLPHVLDDVSAFEVLAANDDPKPPLPPRSAGAR